MNKSRGALVPSTNVLLPSLQSSSWGSPHFCPLSHGVGRVARSRRELHVCYSDPPNMHFPVLSASFNAEIHYVTGAM
jgi:hypothetical protein